jgi:hypothetical protein
VRIPSFMVCCDRRFNDRRTVAVTIAREFRDDGKTLHAF